MKPLITVRPQADRDLDGLADYIANDNPNAASRFCQAANANGVEIIRILHGSRDLKNLIDGSAD